jgi:hypothetical protein
MGQICSNPEESSINKSFNLEINSLRRANPIYNKDDSHISFTSIVKKLQRANPIFDEGQSQSIRSFKSIKHFEFNILNENKIKSNISGQDKFFEFKISDALISKSDGFSSINYNRKMHILTLKSQSKEIGLKLSSYSKNVIENSYDYSLNPLKGINDKKKQNKDSLFETRKKLDENIFEIIFREKLIKSVQLENYRNSEIIHLEELILPFPDENDLEKIQDDNYIKERIEEIKNRLGYKFLIYKFHIDTSTKEEVNKFLSCKIDNEKNNDSFYFDENIYIGINFKLINHDTYVIYFLYAEKFL